MILHPLQRLLWPHSLNTHGSPTPSFIHFSAWLCREESDPRYITGAADVKLRAFNTSVHSVEALVSYKAD